jgi:phage terminase large subunit GpA-like protein
MQLSGPSEQKGAWKNTRLQKFILDAVTQPGITDITVMSSAQIGKTEIRLCIMGYYMDYEPVPQMGVDPTIEMARAFSRNRLAKMIKDTPALESKVLSARSEKKTGNAILHKEYPGGEYTGAGANSPASLAGYPKAVVICDDLDRFKVTKEGDPMELAFKRTTTFRKKKRISFSTPTIKGQSRIEDRWNKSDKRIFEVQCPDPACAHWQELRFDGDVFKFIYERDDYDNYIVTDAWYECEKCHGKITERMRRKLLETMRERVTNPKIKTHAGFFVWEIYNPSSTMVSIAQGFLESKDNNDTLQVFTNTVLGKLWEVKALLGKDPDEFKTAGRIEKYTQPTREMFLITCAVDVQENRLEYQIHGWGMNEETWILARGVVPGKCLRSDTWDRLYDILQMPIEYENGMKRMIDIIGIDSGFNATTVYPVVRKLLGMGFDKAYAIKGWSGQNSDDIIYKQTQEKKYRIRLITFNVDRAKDTIFYRLDRKEVGEGYIHFNESCDSQFFEQLTSEVKITKVIDNRSRQVWQKKHKNAANEALDLTGYNLGLIKTLAPINWESVKKRFLKKYDEYGRAKPEPVVHESEPETEHKKKNNPRRRSRQFGYNPKDY